MALAGDTRNGHHRASAIVHQDGRENQSGHPHRQIHGTRVTEWGDGAISPEGIRGDSSNNVQKPVTLETGITVQVPLFIKTGEKIKVDTRTGKYVERA